MTVRRFNGWQGRGASRGMALAVAMLAGLSTALAGEAPPEAARPPEASTPSEVPNSAEAPKPAVAASPPQSAKAGDVTLAPYLAVRSLQALQDKVAHGSAAAQAAQPKMLVHVAEVFATADPAVWKDARNANAAALYLFSAGRAAVMRAVLERATLTPQGDRLVKGALAYAEGQDEIARTLLGKFDPRTLPASLGGHLALVMATLLTEKDPAKAQAMLDAARLLVPGTLVEEAALRRQIFLLADPVSITKFASLSRQYIRRFRGSIFASNFKERLASFATRVAVSGDVGELGQFEAVFAELPQAERRALYLGLARSALVAGRGESARYAAVRAESLSPDPVEAERARLYAAAATAASDAAPAARTALGAVDPTRLSARDADLRDAALAVAGSVDDGLGDRGSAMEQGTPASDTPAGSLIDRAKRALARSDALLASAAPPPDTATPAVAAPTGGTP